MAELFYIQLVALSAGTLAYLFLIALILGHRRPRWFERVLFFLVLSLFLIYAGGLLEINGQIQYGIPPHATRIFYSVLNWLGFAFLPGLLLHAHFAYARYIRRLSMSRVSVSAMWLVVGISYAQPFVMAVVKLILLRHLPGLITFQGFLSWMGADGANGVLLAVMLCGIFEFWIARGSSDRSERRFFGILCGVSGLIFAILALRTGFATIPPLQRDSTTVLLECLGIFPGALLIYFSLRHNFLEFGAQRNLMYALSASFLALLYLAFVRRLGVWLEPVLPPEATASILLFVLIFLFEPLERAIGPALERRFRERVGRVQKLAGDLQEQARQGNLEKFRREAESKIREEFGLAVVRISIPRDAAAAPLATEGGLGHTVTIPLPKGREVVGVLEAGSTGAYLTGETSAALEFLAEQLPAMADLCGLIEEKLHLERELAERERMALLGQMAASVSHNLRNPLSSMKTVLQVQLENPDLPLDVRHDCALVVDEIDRMSAKLAQLLRFAKPSVNGQRVGAVAVARQIAALFGRDAERRNVRLEFSQPAEEISVVASEEAFSEALSNLIVNAIEAQPDGGRVRVALDRHASHLEVIVEDDGLGISAEARAKIFQPFYTTKTTGTGLGLAIVARRLAEMGGTLACESPARDGKGTRFRVTLPLAESEAK